MRILLENPAATPPLSIVDGQGLKDFARSATEATKRQTRIYLLSEVTFMEHPPFVPPPPNVAYTLPEGEVG